MLRIIWKMTLRRLNPLLKKPAAIMISMFQSIIWLVLFGNLFSGMAQITGFEHHSYISYLLPGVMIMNALFIGIYLGLGTVSDLQSGVMHRFLTAPIGRLSIVFSDILYLAILQWIQSAILILISLLMGARIPFGIWGALLYMIVPILFAMAVGALSISAALITRRHESMINIMQFGSLPLMFLSSAFMPQEFMPKWISWISTINPVDWAVSLERAAMNSHGFLGWMPYAILLLAFGSASLVFCHYSFNRYRRSI